MPKARKQSGLQAVIAANVRRLREGKGLSQEALADVCGYHRTDIAGLDRSYTGKIERGEKNVSLVNINRIADALQVDVAELFRKG